MINADMHCHLCKNDPADMATAARKKIITTLGLSEHEFQLTEVRNLFPYFGSNEGGSISLDQYFSRIGEIAAHGLDVLYGLELDLVPKVTAKAWGVLKQADWDFVIGSVHSMDGQSLHEIRATGTASGGIWHQYLDLQTQWIQTGYCDILAHPLRLAYSVPRVPEDIADMLTILARTARQNRVAIEINAADFTISPALVDLLAGICADNSTLVSIGSDAHAPSHIGQCFADIEGLLRKHNIRTYTVYRYRRPHTVKLDEFPIAAALSRAAASF